MSYAYRTRRQGGAPRSRHQKQNRRNSKSNNLDQSLFIKKATQMDEEVYVPQNAFADFDVHPLLKQNLEKMGYVTPTPIQDQSIPIALEGRDVIGVASTGTGKTAAFALPLLHALINQPGAKALIVAPTRELALQIMEECRELGTGTGLRGAMLIGGTAMGPQLRELRNKPDIIIGTPGRIKDHLDRKTLRLDDCNIVVLDEVDRMLDMGFVHDVRTLLSATSNDRQSYFFSATLDTRVGQLIETFAKEPVLVKLKVNRSSDSVHQDIIKVEFGSQKVDLLHDILTRPDVSKSIVFAETQRSVERLSKELIGRGFQADAIHGGKSQSQRQRALDKFKKDHITILVATDVAARGIDVPDVSHVINYSQPQSYDDYVHRIGRAGRAGRIGYALTFVDA